MPQRKSKAPKTQPPSSPHEVDRSQMEAGRGGVEEVIETPTDEVIRDTAVDPHEVRPLTPNEPAERPAEPRRIEDELDHSGLDESDEDQAKPASGAEPHIRDKSSRHRGR